MDAAMLFHSDFLTFSVSLLTLSKFLVSLCMSKSSCILTDEDSFHKNMVWYFIYMVYKYIQSKRMSDERKYQILVPVHCKGRILHVVQTSRLFPDSKTFVDMNIKTSSHEVMDSFEEIMAASGGKPKKETLMEFIHKHFESRFILEAWMPPDYKPNPKFLAQIKNDELRMFAKDIVSIWPKLGRKIHSVVLAKQRYYSVVAVPNGYIIPGGRFKEFYYWDSYWIIKGLLLSEMFDTVRGIIDNFVFMVKVYGFVPNGGRTYYCRRTQPPMLTPMATLYFRNTGDMIWLQETIAHLDKELQFWLKNRTVQVQKFCKTYTLARYYVQSTDPRAESYVEDLNTARFFKSDKDKIEFYCDIQSAAESGWDFSSRWFVREKGQRGYNLTMSKTSRIIPVDLNAILYRAFTDLAFLYECLKNNERQHYWHNKAEEWKTGIRAILWNHNDKMWYDFDYVSGMHRKNFYPSNVTPLWALAFNLSERHIYGKYVVDYLNKHNVMDYEGGIPTSFDESGEQWDYPNAWPPLQAIVIQGLEKSGHPEALAMARVLAWKWIETNLIGFKNYGSLFEKYDAVRKGAYGAGGEYEPQFGFGWTNGVALELINYYFKDLENPMPINTN